MDCPQCGYVMDPFESACPKCAKAGRTGTATAAPPVMAAPPVAPQYQPPPEPAQPVPRQPVPRQQEAVSSGPSLGAGILVMLWLCLVLNVLTGLGFILGMLVVDTSGSARAIIGWAAPFISIAACIATMCYRAWGVRILLWSAIGQAIFSFISGAFDPINLVFGFIPAILGGIAALMCLGRMDEFE